jgi:catechol 2,3-dioxygenase-like lactoylglutathione lyase family enzyme
MAVTADLRMHTRLEHRKKSSSDAVQSIERESAWHAAINDGPNRPRGRAMSTAAVCMGVGQIARTVSDIQESEQWFRDVLGLVHLFTFDTLAFFDCGGTQLMLSQANDLAAGESLLYFRVANIDSAHEQLIERGAEFISVPHCVHRHDDGTEEWMAFFKDPEGRPLAIMASRLL